MNEISETTREGKGFGSTDTPEYIDQDITTHKEQTYKSNPQDEANPQADSATALDTPPLTTMFLDAQNDIVCKTSHTMSPPIQSVILNTNTNGLHLTMDVDMKGRHPTLGLELLHVDSKIKVTRCKPDTPSAKLPKWRRYIKHSNLKKINTKEINSIKDAVEEIKQAKQNKEKQIKCTFATNEFVDINLQEGIPQLHYDQPCLINKHHMEERLQEECWHDVEEAPPAENPSTNRIEMQDKLTRGKLMKLDE